MPEVLNSLKSARLPQHRFRVCRNAVIMLVNNLNVCRGMCNGTRLRVRNMHRRFLEVEILTGSRRGDVFWLPRMVVADDLSFPFPVYRKQFPAKLAMAMTINKGQGQTFNLTGIQLINDVFAHGQLYTALSRARSWDGIWIRLPDGYTTTEVDNVVYTEIFSRH
jgi:ATP-dependent exoDNAse (exonuclease V) alpha subunit